MAVVAHFSQWTAETVAMAHGAGLRAVTYTANEPAEVERLCGLGLDGIVTDRIDLFPAR